MISMTDDELKAMFEALRQENVATRQENAAAHVETRRHFDVTAERLESRIDLVAESVGLLDEKCERRFTAIEQSIERNAAETQSMIKFSHSELDRRLRSVEQGQSTLESTVAEIQARLDRIESSTH
jgi:septal ring factor EnvC (AmiA/AmiB activator)